MRLFALLLLGCTLNMAFLLALPPASESDLLDSTHPEKARSAVDRAIESGHPEHILIGLRNERLTVQLYCLEKIETLPRAVGAPLLADIMLDDTLYVNSGVPMQKHSSYIQTRMRMIMTEAACQYLGEPAPGKAFILTRSEKSALAIRLKSVK